MLSHVRSSIKLTASNVNGLLPLRQTYSTAKLLKYEVANGFDKDWVEMSEEDRNRVSEEYHKLEKQDWRTLTKEQARNLYTIAYGVPEPHDSLWGWKVFGGTMGVIAAGCGLFALARSFGITNYYFLFLIDYLYLLLANPPPRTLSPEYQRAMEEYMRSQNLEPFNGISAQKQSQPSIDELRIA